METVAADEWRTWVEDNDAAVLDIREPDEWALGTLPGAVLIPMGEVAGRIGELDRDRPLLVVCRSGSRSHHVARYLAILGYRRVANMVGGMKALGLQD